MNASARTPLPSEVDLHPIGTLVDAFDKAETEFAAALVVRWHQVHSPGEWRPVSRRTLLDFLEQDPIALTWCKNPFWQPDPNRLRDEGWIDGWRDADEPGLFTDKALKAIASRGAGRRAKP